MLHASLRNGPTSSAFILALSLGWILALTSENPAQASGELRGPIQISAGTGPVWLQSNHGYPGLLIQGRFEFFPAAQPYFSMGPGIVVPITGERQRGTPQEGGETGRFSRVGFEFSGRVYLPTPAFWIRLGGGLAYETGNSSVVSSKLAPTVSAGLGFRGRIDDRWQLGGELALSHTSQANASIFAPSVLAGTVGDYIPQANAISLSVIADFQL